MKKAMVERAFTEQDRETLREAKETIEECQRMAEGLAERIASQLWLVNSKELYKLDDFTSMGEWAQTKYGISKGTCSDSIATYERFRDKENHGHLQLKWRQYAFSTLMAMKKLSDSEIERAGIQPTMSRVAIKDAIKAMQLLEEKEKERPAKMKELDRLIKVLHAMLGGDTEKVREAITSVIPDFFDKGKVNTVDEIIACIESISATIDSLNTKKDKPAEEEPTEEESTEEESTEEEADEEEPTEEESTEEEPTEEQSSKEEFIKPEGEQSNFGSIPTIEINVNDFRNEVGAINKKAFLAAVWDKAQDVFNSNAELIITWSE